MIVTEASSDVVSFSAEPEWLDDVVRQLQDEAGRPSRSAGRERKRNMARDILECGYIGPDGRVQLFFSNSAYAAFKETVEAMKIPRRRHGHQGRLKGAGAGPTTVPILRGGRARCEHHRERN